MLAGCAAENRLPPPPQPPRPPGLVAEEALARGAFDDVIKESERALAADDSNVSADTALFTLGMAYAHPRNPAQNLAAAKKTFATLLRDYPASPWATQAKVWLEVVREREALGEAVSKLQADTSFLEQVNKRLKDEQEASLQAQKKLRDENENLQQVIRRMKQVDIEIEEKKREKAR